MHARELQGLRRLPEIVIDDAVELRPQLLLDRGVLQSDETAAEQFGVQPDLVGGAHDADGVGRIGGAEHDVGVGRVDRPHDRGVVGGVRRIGLVVDDLQPRRLGVPPRTLGGVARELGIGRDDRQRLRLGALRRRHLEEALRKGGAGVGAAGRLHREIAVVVELVVHIEAEQRKERHLVLDDDRHRRGQQIGAVIADRQVDLVDVEQLRKDAGYRRRIALVVVIDQLDRAAEQPALGVGLLLPDLHRQQGRLAAGRETAGQRHAEADLDRLRRPCRYCRQSAEQRSDGEQSKHAR